jgi:CheY-like chemotaxis protein
VMPRMNGRELCHRLRSWYPKIRFLFVSGYLGNAPREASEATTAFLRKPFTADGLHNVVRSLLDRRAS